MVRVLVALAFLVAVPTGSVEARDARDREAPCDGARRYRGPAIDLDLKEADLHSVFRFLADAGSVNIVVPDDVRGSITLRLKRVPWEQALCTVIRAKKLELWREATIYTVSTGK